MSVSIQNEKNLESLAIGKNFHVFQAACENIMFSLERSLVVEIIDDDLFTVLSEIENDSDIQTASYAYIRGILSRREWSVKREECVLSGLLGVEHLTKPTQPIGQERPEINNANASDIHISGITLVLSEACNMRCKYCYTGLQNSVYPPRLMSKEIARGAIDMLLNRLVNTAPGIKVLFIGGEPLLNITVLKHVIEYARTQVMKRNRGTRFDLTTNGTLLDKTLIDYLYRNNVNLLISLDGDERGHDRYRMFPDGSGTHTIIMKNLEYLRKVTGQLAVRATWTPNGPTLRELIKYFETIGVTSLLISPVMETEQNNRFEDFTFNQEIISIYSNQVMDILPDIYASLRSGKRPLYDPIAGKSFNFFNQTSPNSLAYPCNCGFNGLAIGAVGEIYPCHRFWGMDRYVLGNISKWICDKKYTSFWHTYFDSVTQYCLSCWARYHCFGACIRGHAFSNGTFQGSNDWHCRYIKTSLELQIAYFAKMLRESPKQLYKILNGINKLRELDEVPAQKT